CSTYLLHDSLSRPSLYSFPTRRSSDLQARGLLQTRFSHTLPASASDSCEQRPRWHIRLGQICSLDQQALGLLDSQRRPRAFRLRSEEHTSELQSPDHLVCRLLLEKKQI